jgi:hypothetical protein
VWVYNSNWSYSGVSYDLSANVTFGTALWQLSNGHWIVLEKEWMYDYDASFVYTGTRHTLRYGSPIVYGLNGYGMCQSSVGNWYVCDINDDRVNEYNSSYVFTGNYWSVAAQDGVMTGIWTSL